MQASAQALQRAPASREVRPSKRATGSLRHAGAVQSRAWAAVLWSWDAASLGGSRNGGQTVSPSAVGRPDCCRAAASSQSPELLHGNTPNALF